MTKNKEKKHRTKRAKNMRTRIMRAIVFIIFLSILIPVAAYYFLPDYVYLFVPGTKLWIAADDVASSYGTDDFLDAVRYAEQKYNATIEIYNKDGVFIYSSRAIIDSLPTDLSEAEAIDEAYKTNYATETGALKPGQRGFIIKDYSDTYVTAKYLDCYNYFDGGERVELSMQVTNESSTAKIDFILSFTTLMFILIVALIVISVYLKKFTKPVNKLCEITDSISKLDFSQTCPSNTGISEMDMLSESVNSLSQSLSAALEDLQTKNKKLEEDIENERTIDNLRQTFISGISHEMKTPISIISGYAEGAKIFYESGNKETAEQYCDIIVKESGRMNAMIMKLLEITKYSSGAYQLETSDFSISELAEDWFTRNESILSEKGITTKNEIPSELIGTGDKIILESVVNNYLSNAVSHCEGDMLISASAEDRGEFYRVYFFNTGKHIDNKDIDKIWDSFYRADKSLSRSQGRFGLGLAIVAAIQKLHEAEYGVENVEGGVSFYFDIKKSTTTPSAE